MGLREALAAGRFVITTEVMPPHGVDMDAFLRHADQLAGKVDAVNVTESQRAMAHCGSIACCKHLIDHGLDAVMHLNCRDMNRLALQAHVMSGYALGIRNVLVIGGDPVKNGNQPDTKEVYDLNPGTALDMCRGLKAGVDMAGDPLAGAPLELMTGATSNPTHPDMAVEISKTLSKIDGGADFFQTQGIYDVERTREFMGHIRAFGVPIIAGIIPLRNAKIAEMIKYKIPGTHVPDAVYERHVNATDIAAEALEFSVETIAALKGVVDGVHIMTIGSRKLTEAIIERVHALGL
ncbi:MAG: methylenetetrahydrofolate reductase [bacterium]